jgi:hypothetical protein
MLLPRAVSRRILQLILGGESHFLSRFIRSKPKVMGLPTQTARIGRVPKRAEESRREPKRAEESRRDWRRNIDVDRFEH